ncbi:flagellar motor protein MotB [Sphingobacteriales bacterium UPWRP_1]|nr:hypothetical protein BVG80_10650 [Sphingobacteriales bacterium TSM_CSM]PSJ78875.1 flagellar motor protein MotB [Sphingobacteriales bacterium UPWRP_1]
MNYNPFTDKPAALLMLCVILLLTSCVSAKKYKNMEYERNTAYADKVNAQQRIDNLEGMLKKIKTDTANFGMAYRNLNEQYSTLKASSTLTAQQLSQQLQASRKELRAKEDTLYRKELQLLEREQLVQELQMAIERKELAQRALIESLQAALVGFSAEDLQIERKGGKVYVSLSEKLLFQSGQADVDEQGKMALLKLAEVLNRNPNIDITVEGHTDNVPIKTAVYKDNWDLSVYRATTVARILSEMYGVSTTRILASGRGEFFPVADNGTYEGRARNRRTEIILMPKLDEVYRTLETSANARTFNTVPAVLKPEAPVNTPAAIPEQPEQPEPDNKQPAPQNNLTPNGVNTPQPLFNASPELQPGNNKTDGDNDGGGLN